MAAEQKKYEPINPENMEQLAKDLIDYFVKLGVFSDICIYVNSQAFKSNKYCDETDLSEAKTDTGNKYYIRKNVDIKKQLEYSNPDTVSIVFEGPLYHLINYDDYDFIAKLTKKFLTKYNLYFEQGYAWSMTAYK